MRIFNFRERNLSQPAKTSTQVYLCTVKIVSQDDFKAFAEFCKSHRFYINYAFTDITDWDRAEIREDCYAVIKYNPEAGAGHYIRVDFHTWTPYTTAELSKIIEQSKFNFKSVDYCVKNFLSGTIYWTLDALYRIE